jgi:hypothetical protein
MEEIKMVRAALGLPPFRWRLHTLLYWLLVLAVPSYLFMSRGTMQLHANASADQLASGAGRGW